MPDAQHVTIADAVRRALEAHALAAGVAPNLGRRGDRSPEAVARRRARMDQIVQEIAAMPILDRRASDEIIDRVNAL